MKAVIARSDLVTAYGWGMDALWSGLISGQTAIKSGAQFSAHVPVNNQLALIPDLNVPPGSSRARSMLDRLLLPLVGKLDRQTSLMLATTVCEIEFIERSVLQQNPTLAGNASPQVLLAYIKQLLGLFGSGVVISSACASSATALTRAACMIESGSASAVLVITCDVISEFVYSGFSTLLSLCDTPARPFDVNRCGLSLGEAAAWALVTSDESPLAGKDSPIILGWSNTTDAVHMTAPDRAAGGLTRAITQACRMAGIQSKEIGFIAAHGTATIYNDAMELLAFRNSLPRPVPTFSIKGGTGHTLAVAGLAQILVACQAMKLRVVPPTVGLSVPDENAIGWVHNQSTALGEKTIVLSTNSGFGGLNTSILLRLSEAHGSLESPGDDETWDSPQLVSQGKNGGDRTAQFGGSPHDSAPLDRPVSAVSVGWFSSDTCGSISSNGGGFVQRSVPISSSKEMAGLIGASPKYFARMTSEARCCLAAAGLAMRAAGWSNGGVFGILGAGYDGWLAAGQEYFRDYVAQGRSLGRANLFIYTLPTSAMSEIAIALALTGPTLHLHADDRPTETLLHQANSIVRNREADGLLCVWSDGPTAICFAIGRGKGIDGLADFGWDQSGSEMVRRLAELARR